MISTNEATFFGTRSQQNWDKSEKMLKEEMDALNDEVRDLSAKLKTFKDNYIGNAEMGTQIKAQTAKQENER